MLWNKDMAVRNTAKAKADSSAAYIDEINEKIIKALEAGTAPWQQSWEGGSGRLPQNFATKENYHGMNTVLLLLAAEDHGYTDNRWLTYKQAQELGGHVRKGEHGERCYRFLQKVYFERDEQGNILKDDEGRPFLKMIRGLKAFTVFNVSQIEGLKLDIEETKKHEWTPVERAERLIEASGAKIRHVHQGRAFYRPMTDEITLPEKTQFRNAEGYYDTLLHELGHWTGHETRLNRDLSGEFGTEKYAKEELRAEIASMMLGGTLGISHDVSNHAAYVKSWVKILKEDKYEIFRACADAERIQTFILGFEQKRIWMLDEENETVMRPSEESLIKLARNAMKKVKIDFDEYAAKLSSEETSRESDLDAAIHWFEKGQEEIGRKPVQFFDEPEELYETVLSITDNALLLNKAENIIKENLGESRLNAVKVESEVNQALRNYQSAFAKDDNAPYPSLKDTALLLRYGCEQLSANDRFRLSYAAADSVIGKNFENCQKDLWEKSMSMNEADINFRDAAADALAKHAPVKSEDLDLHAVRTVLMERLADMAKEGLELPVPDSVRDEWTKEDFEQVTGEVLSDADFQRLKRSEPEEASKAIGAQERSGGVRR